MACIKNGGLWEFGTGEEIDLLSSSYAVRTVQMCYNK